MCFHVRCPLFCLVLSIAEMRCQILKKLSNSFMKISLAVLWLFHAYRWMGTQNYFNTRFSDLLSHLKKNSLVLTFHRPGRSDRMHKMPSSIKSILHMWRSPFCITTHNYSLTINVIKYGSVYTSVITNNEHVRGILQATERMTRNKQIQKEQQFSNL
jgi:hypothetical protein